MPTSRCAEFQVAEKHNPRKYLGTLPLWNCPVRFWFYRMNKSGNLCASWIKKIGVLLPTRSKYPLQYRTWWQSHGYHARYRRASAALNGREPNKYWGDFVVSERKSALVISLKLLYGWKYRELLIRVHEQYVPGCAHGQMSDFLAQNKIFQQSWTTATGRSEF